MLETGLAGQEFTMKTALTLTLLVATLALAGCTNRRDKEVIPYGFEGQDVHAKLGPDHHASDRWPQ